MTLLTEFTTAVKESFLGICNIYISMFNAFSLKGVVTVLGYVTGGILFFGTLYGVLWLSEFVFKTLL